ncbi:MAG: hypothetical protein ABL962_22255 [Fimbriimonadaceae bacterium]
MRPTAIRKSTPWMWATISAAFAIVANSVAPRARITPIGYRLPATLIQFSVMVGAGYLMARVISSKVSSYRKLGVSVAIFITSITALTIVRIEVERSIFGQIMGLTQIPIILGLFTGFKIDELERAR